jgi:cell division protein FtsZ
MNIKLELPKLTDLQPRITVIGVGGAGGNAINNMIASGLAGVEFVVANTDAQALSQSSAEHRIQLGTNLTEGLGAGSRPEIGQAAAEEALDEVRTQISGSHMVFVAAGMGGGTGSGAAGVIARVAKELGILTVGIVTKPFTFEGGRRMRVAEAGIAELARYVDTLIVIPNQNLFRIANERTTFAEAFVLADQVLYSGIACIVDLIIKDGLINLDFADVRTVMSGMGTAMMGTGEASGDRRAILAAEEAISNPLLDDVSLRGARGLLLSIIGGKDMTLFEVDEAASRIRQEVDPEANIIVGASFDEEMGDRLRVSIVASGMARLGDPVAVPPQRSSPPPLPGGSVQAAPEGLAHLLARASEPATVAAGPAPQPPKADHDSGVWQAPGNVTINQGLPPLTMQAPPAPSALSVPAVGASTFTPRPAQDLSPQQRRMPEVDDFPAVGQREYRARATAAVPATGAGPRVYKAAGGSAPRKPGLFERLTNLGKGGRESNSNGDSNERAVKSYPQSGKNSVDKHQSGDPVGHQPTTSGDATRSGAKPTQAVGLPVFFNRERH